MARKTTAMTHVGRLLKEYEGRLHEVPEVVRDLPLYTDYEVRRVAIDAGLPQPLHPRELLRYLLVDDPRIADDPNRQFDINKLERALNFQRGSFKIRMLAPKDLERELPKPLQKTLEKLSGKENFWNRSSFSSAELSEIHFNFGKAKPNFQDKLAAKDPSSQGR